MESLTALAAQVITRSCTEVQNEQKYLKEVIFSLVVIILHMNSSISADPEISLGFKSISWQKIPLI